MSQQNGNQAETETNGAQHGSSFMTYITRSLIKSLINWPLLRGYFSSLGRALVAVAIVEWLK